MNRLTFASALSTNFFPSNHPPWETSSRHWINKHEYNNLIMFLTSLRWKQKIWLAIWLMTMISRFSSLQIQIFGYNSQLYSNFSDAVFRAQGIVAVSVLLQVRVDFEVTISSNWLCTSITARRSFKSGTSDADGSIRENSLRWRWNAG